MDLDLSETEFKKKKKKCVLCRLGLHFLIFGYTFSLKKKKKETHMTKVRNASHTSQLCFNVLFYNRMIKDI